MNDRIFILGTIKLNNYGEKTALINFIKYLWSQPRLQSA